MIREKKNGTDPSPVLSLAAFVIGCEPANRTSSTEAEQLREDAAERYEEAREETREAAEEVRDATRDAADNTAEFTENQKTAFIAQMEQRLAAMRTEASAIQSSLANSAEDIKAEGQEKWWNWSGRPINSNDN